MKVNAFNSILGFYDFKLVELHWGRERCGVSAFIKAKLSIQAESIFIQIVVTKLFLNVFQPNANFTIFLPYSSLFCFLPSLLSFISLSLLQGRIIFY